jgi:hypothetical protein
MRSKTWIGALTLFGFACALAPAATSAQTRVDASVLWESYSFDGTLLPYGDVSELSLPVSASVALGTVGELAVSTAYVRVKLSLAEGGEALEHLLSGVADTEARLTLNIVRDRLVFIATAAIPTGIESVEGDQQDVLNVLVTDVLGFYTQRLGSGGSVGGGLAGAVQAGRMAFGFAGSYTTFASYQPLVGSGDVNPGGEFRFRGGVEGPVAEDTYLRVAAIFGMRGKDQLGDSELPGLGNRFGGYVSLDQGVGSATLSLYAFDLFRSDPQTGQSVLGTALPRGNLIAAGARLTVPAGQQVRLTPRVEWRRSDRAVDVDASSLVKLGDALRFGADVRLGVAPGMDVVFQGDGLVGSVQSGVADVTGYRVGVTFSVTR